MSEDDEKKDSNVNPTDANQEQPQEPVSESAPKPEPPEPDDSSDKQNNTSTDESSQEPADETTETVEKPPEQDDAAEAIEKTGDESGDNNTDTREDRAEEDQTQETEANKPKTEDFHITDHQPTDQIFVVLSKREDLNQECIAAVLKTGARFIIVNDPDEKRSIREITAQHPHVKFALVILAGDDFIYDRLTGKPGEATLTAKSDVSFALGYFLAKFDNIGIMAIYKEQKSFRLPVGQHHLAFVPYQKGAGWEKILQSKLQQLHII